MKETAVQGESAGSAQARQGLQPVRNYDLFNGDADGLCALHQLRMAEPRDAELVTGTKREIDLFRRLPDGATLAVTALDISFDRNCDDVRRVLLNGGSVRYFDHHAARTLFDHPRLEAHIDTAADQCTSLLVDSYLKGRHRAWAIVAAYGDNLSRVGDALAKGIDIPAQTAARLRRLGELLNYNAYGETVADLHLPPPVLFRALHNFVEPLDFVASSAEFRQLSEGFDADQAERSRVKPHWRDGGVAVYVLPGEPWARRISGSLANELANQDPDRSIAVLTPRTDEGFLVSVRLSPSCPQPADVFCSRFPGGGGRKAAGGIDRISAEQVPMFIESFSKFLKEEVL